jgi:hypothetical protein
MNDPRSGPTVSIESHQAAGVFPPMAAKSARQASAKRRMGLKLAMAMTTKTKIASVYSTPSK